MNIEREVLEREIANGLTLSAISKKHGWALSSVHRKLNQYGIEYTDSRKAEINREYVANLLRKGKTREFIANQLGVSAVTLRLFIRNNGLESIVSYDKERIAKEMIAIESRKTERGVICKLDKGSVTVNSVSRRCLYGGRCSNCDCCDKLYLTGERRRYDKENPHRCFDFVEATKKEKEAFRKLKNDMASDVVMY